MHRNSIFGLIQLVLLLLLIVHSNSCDKATNQNITEDLTQLEYTVDLVIGHEPHSEYLLGNPVGILTDSLGAIYIADNGSKQILKFNGIGRYLNSIGQQGSGPGEFFNFSLFEQTPNGYFFIVDKGRFRYSTITQQGEELSSKPIDISKWQFYPNDVEFIDDKIISLYKDGNRVTPESTPFLQRSLFYIHSRDLEVKYSEFFPYNQLTGLQEKFAAINFIDRSGSFIFNSTKNGYEIIYSPRLFTGTLYKVRQIDSGWEISSFQTSTPYHTAFTLYNEAEFNSLLEQKLPGLKRTYFDQSEPYRGRVNSTDEGIFRLNDGRIIQFRSEWSDLKSTKNANEPILLDINVQIIDGEDVVLNGHLFSLEVERRPWKPLINWKDDQDRFYLLHSSKDSVLVKRFSINLDS